MPPCLITCIVPVLNFRRYAKAALDSILAQTYHPLEIILANDGSTDGTATVVADYSQQVRYACRPTLARNRTQFGAERSTG
jgi:glycosyltransferase involved in cell wall biosynthesis